MICCLRGLARSVKSGSKNYSKSKPKMEGILALILGGFGSVLGAKLGGKLEPRWKKNGIENMMQNKSRLERVLERFWLHFGLQNQTLGGIVHAPFSLLTSALFSIWFFDVPRRPKTSPRRPQDCLLYTSPSPRDKRQSRMPSSA